MAQSQKTTAGITDTAETRPKSDLRSMSRGKSSVRTLEATERWDKCYEKRAPMKREPCNKEYLWQRTKYKRDSCGSGFLPMVQSFGGSRDLWCKTPLSSYQGTIGEIGRQILCQELKVPRDVRSEPPCTICVNILPLCRGYYRKYECIRPCEEEYAKVKGGQKIYRDVLSRYWDQCTDKAKTDINKLAPHNAVLGEKMIRYSYELDCFS